MLDRLADVFKSFQEREVRYVVIGGIAAVLHGVPRATFDLDILIDSTPDNAHRLLARRGQTMNYMGQKFFVVSKRDLIASKHASGGAVDLEDARLLELPETPSD